MLIQLLITVISWFILMYLGVNLLGLLVRGLFSDPEIDKLRLKGSEFIRNDAEKIHRIDKRLNIIALILIIAYLYSLFHFWNIGVLLAAIMLMTGRLQGLLWEIKHGKKTDTKLMPKNFIYNTSSLLILGSFPVLWYFLYYF